VQKTVSEEDDYYEYSNDELVQEYVELFKVYYQWIGKKFVLDDIWQHEVFELIAKRDILHELIIELDRRHLPHDVVTLKEQDHIWQEWLLDHTDPNFDFKIQRNDKPKEEWWWWIDQLDTLTDEQKTTL
jgi:hypothetical protein